MKLESLLDGISGKGLVTPQVPAKQQIQQMPSLTQDKRVLSTYRESHMFERDAGEASEDELIGGAININIPSSQRV